jgi:hypothetical protein
MGLIRFIFATALFTLLFASYAFAGDETDAVICPANTVANDVWFKNNPNSSPFLEYSMSIDKYAFQNIYISIVSMFGEMNIQPDQIIFYKIYDSEGNPHVTASFHQNSCAFAWVEINPDQLRAILK